MRSQLPSFRIWLLLGLAVCAALLSGHTAHGRFASAQTPTNVTLLYFSAESVDAGVRLEWETGSELDTAGFVIERGQGGNFIRLDDIGFITATGSPTIGSIYTAVDETAVLNTTYTYRLYEVEGGGGLILLEDTTITYNLVPTATPISLGGQPTATRSSGNQPTATASATAMVTATPTAPGQTATPNTAVTSTPTPRATTTNGQLATPTSQSFIQTTPPATSAATSESTQSLSQPPGATIAQAQEPTAPANGYPGAPTAAPTLDSGYPAPAATPVTAPTTDTGYVAPLDNGSAIDPNNSGQPPTIIGADNQTDQALFTPAPGAPSAAVSASDVATGRLFLWGGFIVAFLIFIVAVVGAMALLTRQKS